MSNTSIYIPRNNLNCGGIYTYDITLQGQNQTILRGIVYDSSGQIMPGAIVELQQIDDSTNVSSVLGYSTTNALGEYVFIVEVSISMSYKVTVYSTP